MDEGPIILEKTDDYEKHVGTAERLGGLDIVTPRGRIFAVDAPGYTTILMECDGDPETARVLMLLYSPAPSGEIGSGMVAQMDATQARSIAASLLRLATRIDTGKPN